jgi:ABC-2 type transport system ATP-binding protein
MTSSKLDSNSIILEVEGITKSFRQDFWSKKHEVLKGVSFSIEKNSLVGFLGSNGAGKTTLIKIILGLIEADNGSVRYGLGNGSQKDFFRQLGHLPERPYLYGDLTGREFLHYMGRLQNLTKQKIEEKISKYINIFKLNHAIARPLRGYSKGMLQRTGFIAAILHDPKFLLLDEPLSGLDPIGRKLFKDIMLELHSNGTTIFFTTHIVPDVEEICDRVVVLKDGTLLFQGPIENLQKTIDKTAAQDRHRFTFFSQEVWATKFLDVEILSQYRLGEKNVVEIALPSSRLNDFIVQHNDLEIISMEPFRPNLEQLIYQTSNI